MGTPEPYQANAHVNLNDLGIKGSLQESNLQGFKPSQVEKLLDAQDDDHLKIPPGFKFRLDSSVILAQLTFLKENKLKLNETNKNAKFTLGQCSNNSKEIFQDSKARLVSTNTDDSKKQPPSSDGRTSHISEQERLRRTNSLKKLLPGASNYGTMASKLKAAAPYHLFLTTIKGAEPTHSEPLSVTFSELLDPTLGDLLSSLQINFMVDLGWLMANYYIHGHSKKPLLILYGADDDETLKDPKKLPGNIKAVRVKTPHPFGHHHTKMSLFRYSDESIRVIVSTANLVESDWENRTQGLWISPACPKLPADSDTSVGDSPTEFKSDLLRYLTSYKLPQLQEWVTAVRETDFSTIRTNIIIGHTQRPGPRLAASFEVKHLVQPPLWNTYTALDSLFAFSVTGALGLLLLLKPSAILIVTGSKAAKDLEPQRYRRRRSYPKRIEGEDTQVKSRPRMYRIGDDNFIGVISSIIVCFIASVPSTHRGPEFEKWGHRRLASLLKKHVTAPVDSSWNILAQCSSIGSLGPEPEAWMCGELRSSMAQRAGASIALQSLPHFKVIYPSFRNVASSIDGLLGGGCLPYSMKTHTKQAWFTKYLHEWKSSKRHRSEAMPHIKTYARVSSNGQQLAWFHLTSANLSKAAWGNLNKVKGRPSTDASAGAGLYMMSYEAGVLFLPKFLVNDNIFHLDESRGSSTPLFPLPYDLPLSPYSPRDKPWVTEYLYA
uniref:Tyrosyl-DNA phosphodiesterase n=1 Tax=Timema bartmani TaxID=61472 RepID=A0A7R9EMZ3_9NEOP|nr:unnamed protein product [Timema bartmani]